MMKGVIQQVSRCIRSNRWSILLSISIAVYLFILSNFTLWSRIGIQHLKPAFADMQAVLSASDAYRDGYNPYIENPYDPLGRKHVYGRPWLWLGYTGITLAHRDIAALILAAIFLLISICILRPENFKEFLISAMLLLSPAVLLGVERGNNDLFIFIILGLAAFLIHHKIRALNLISYFFLYLAGILKFYPIVSFILFAKIIKDYKKFWIFALFSIFVFGAYVILTYSDFEYLKEVVPRPHGRFTFGAAILFECILDRWPVNDTYVYMLIGSACLMAFLLSSKTGVARIMNDTRNTIFFLIGSLNLLFCFFTNTNFDYRCIFFIMLLPWFFSLLKCEMTPVSTQRCIKAVLLLLPIVVWNETVITLIGSTLGAPGLSEGKLKAMLTFYLFEHASTWIVMTMLLAFCIELLKTPILDKVAALFRSAKGINAKEKGELPHPPSVSDDS